MSFQHRSVCVGVSVLSLNRTAQVALCVTPRPQRTCTVYLDRHCVPAYPPPGNHTRRREGEEERRWVKEQRSAVRSGFVR